MPDFFPETYIRPDQAQAIAHGLYAVARADGQLHPREGALISEFFASTGVAASELGALERGSGIEPATLAQILPDTALRLLFVKTALLLAYTDNDLSAAESKLIADYAKAFGMSDAEVALLTTQVKEYLIAQLAHLHNVDAAIAVAKKLG